MESPIDIILLTHNKLENTIRCVEALYQNTQVSFFLTVIDDSTDETAAYFNRISIEKNNIHYHRPPVFIKCANQAINIGLKITQSDPFIILDNSTFVEPDWLSIALLIMKTNPKVGLVGFKILDPDTNLIIEAGDDVNSDGIAGNVGRGEHGHRYTHSRDTLAIGWAAVLIRRVAIPDELNEDYYIGFRGSDDMDNCLEMRKRGWQIKYNGFGAVYKKLGQSDLAKSDGIHREEIRENYRRFKEKWQGKVPLPQKN